MFHQPQFFRSIFKVDFENQMVSICTDFVDFCSKLDKFVIFHQWFRSISPSIHKKAAKDPNGGVNSVVAVFFGGFHMFWGMSTLDLFFSAESVIYFVWFRWKTIDLDHYNDFQLDAVYFYICYSRILVCFDVIYSQ